MSVAFSWWIHEHTWFEKTPDEVIKRLKELGKESFEEYARRMEAQWKAVEKAEVPEEKAGLTSEGNPLACPGTAAAAEAEVLTVSELLAYCRKEQGEAFTALAFRRLQDSGKPAWTKARPTSHQPPLILWSSC